jgi:alpha-tubulin suppressor-like RCC1 family protein
LKPDGTVWSWGRNIHGQLGLGAASGPYQWTPTQVPGVSGVVAIAAWSQSSLVLKSDGTALSWGTNGLILPGDPDPLTTRKSPMHVPGLDKVVAVSAGLVHWVALRSDGSVWSWGGNDRGQLGTGATYHRPSPVQASSLGEVETLLAGAQYSVALKRDGTVWTWGSNGSGALGDGTRISRALPVQVPGLSGVVAVAAGYGQTLAVKADGTVWAWGDDRYHSRAGDVPTLPVLDPVRVAGLDGVVAVSSDVSHSLALKADGTVWAWGHNEFGQLGDGTTTDRATPVAVSGLGGVVAVSAGYDYSLALKSDGTVWRWGSTQGQACLPDPRDTSTWKKTPERLAGLTGVVAISAAWHYSLALKADGTLWGWGDNALGQLGDRSTTERKTPVQVHRLDNVVSMSASSHHAAAVKADGTLWVWGGNDVGQLGVAVSTTTDHLPVPTRMPDFSGARTVSAGRLHTLVMKTDGTAWAWGENRAGEIGDGSSSFSVTPVQAGVRSENPGG